MSSLAKQGTEGKMEKFLNAILVTIPQVGQPGLWERQTGRPRLTNETITDTRVHSGEKFSAKPRWHHLDK